MKASLKIVSFGIIAGIVLAATLLILFVTGAIDQESLSSNLAKSFAIIGIMVATFLGIVAVVSLNRPDDPDKQ